MASGTMLKATTSYATGSAAGSASSPRSCGHSDRCDEVVAVVASASSDEQAQEAVVALLDLDGPAHAMVVFDMQLRRMTEPSRAHTSGVRQGAAGHPRQGRRSSGGLRMVVHHVAAVPHLL